MSIENALYKFITITILDIEIFIPKSKKQNKKNQKEC